MKIKKIKLPFRLKKAVLALGTHEKNTTCFAKGSFAYISGVHAHLDEPKDFENFTQDVRHFLRRRPKIIAYDLHPEYQSAKFALGLPDTRYQLSAIQHHHAHIAGCMADNGLKQKKVIGVAFDGTGLGSDDTLWGAEFFISSYKNFRRVAHLKEIPLLGGERAIYEPWRVAAVWLYRLYKDNFLRLNLDFVRRIDKKKWQMLKKMYLNRFNSPSASSMGRLFDAAASLILNKQTADFQAQLPMELEKIATGCRLHATGYEFNIIKQKGMFIIDPLLIFKGIVKDLQNKIPKTDLAYKFHVTIAEIIRDMCLKLRKETKINDVVLSGGVFQNKLLLSLACGLLCQYGFTVFSPKETCADDSGISLGQAVIASCIS
ncbi:MAG: hypothetical protein WC658_01495 [Candidatus Omnitrophota bacterium]